MAGEVANCTSERVASAADITRPGLAYHACLAQLLDMGDMELTRAGPVRPIGGLGAARVADQLAVGVVNAPPRKGVAIRVLQAEHVQWSVVGVPLAGGARPDLRLLAAVKMGLRVKIEDHARVHRAAAHSAQACQPVGAWAAVEREAAGGTDRVEPWRRGGGLRAL